MATDLSWLEGLPADVNLDLEEAKQLEEYFSDSDPFSVDEELIQDIDVNKNFEKIVVVQNVPIIPEAKLEKLTNVLGKVFNNCGKVDENGIFLPFGSDGKSIGWAFVKFASAGSARIAQEKTNNLAFDRNHVFKVNLYTDLDKFKNWPEQYSEPKVPDFKPPPRLRSWLLDEAGRDQFVIRHGSNTEIHWCEGMLMKGESHIVYDGERERRQGKIWCEMYTAWSPKGSYLATYHRQGVALWGGKDFQKINRFAHGNVQNLLFSPNEKYLITWNGVDDNKDPRALIVWDVKTGKDLRAFKVAPGSEWPIMRFSADDSLFARGVPDGISVFATKDMKLLEKKPVKAKGMQHFEWSPSDNLIAYWAPEVDNMPARVVLIDPKTRIEVRSKNLFNVREVKLHWQDCGDFLCAQVLRHTKSGKTTFTNCEIFRMRDPNIPNEMLEVKDMVDHFSWEPGRERCAIIHSPTEHKHHVSFYTMGGIKGGDKVELLYTVQDKQCNNLYWSPAGNNLIFAGLDNINGTLEFWDVDENMSTQETEHFMCNEIHWDPSGRMVATVVAQPMFGSVAMRYTLENGYNLWTFQGAPLRKVPMEHFYQFAWRPRPKAILGEEETQKIQKNLRQYMTRFGKLDNLRKKRMDTAANAEKIETLTQFRKLLARKAEIAERDRNRRYELGLWEADNEDDYEITVETEEHILSEKVEPF